MWQIRRRCGHRSAAAARPARRRLRSGAGRPRPSRLFSCIKSATVPSNTRRPSLIRITRLAIASTSCRMCVDSRIVFFSPRSRHRPPHLADLVRIQAGRRLVQNQHVRLVQQRLGHAHTLPIPLGQLADRLVEHAAQHAQFDDRLDPSPAAVRGTCRGRRRRTPAGCGASCRDTAARFPAGSPAGRSPARRSVAMSWPAIRATPSDGAR